MGQRNSEHFKFLLMCLLVLCGACNNVVLQDDADEEEDQLCAGTIVCGGEGDSCYEDAAAMDEGFAITPSDQCLKYVDADGAGSGTFKIWVEDVESSSCVLQADGFEGWQKKLNANGRSYAADDFTNVAEVGGRVCPANVYLNDSQQAVSNRCLYFDTGNANAKFSVVAEFEAGDQSKWFSFNVATCGDKGMRLPTLFETDLNICPNSQGSYPNACQLSPITPSDIDPVFSERDSDPDTVGVPAVANENLDITWTVTPYPDDSYQVHGWDHSKGGAAHG
jgi:hypothetical protein